MVNNNTNKTYVDYRELPHKTDREMLIANAYYLRKLEKEGQRPLYGRHGELCLTVEELLASDEELSITR